MGTDHLARRPVVLAAQFDAPLSPGIESRLLQNYQTSSASVRTNPVQLGI
jgi:hypothetical protein